MIDIDERYAKCSCCYAKCSGGETMNRRASAPAAGSDMVQCGCGDGYPADSYEAGFIDGKGHCENCDAGKPAAGSGPSDSDLIMLAVDFKTQYAHGGQTFDEFDAVGYARALLSQYGSAARSKADHEIIEAARNLVKVKGRHHGELAYKRLADAVASAPQEGK